MFSLHKVPLSAPTLLAEGYYIFRPVAGYTSLLLIFVAVGTSEKFLKIKTAPYIKFELVD